VLPADPREALYSRFFCCQAVTARVGDALTSECWLVQSGMSKGTRAALATLPKATSMAHGEKPEITDCP